jgi:Zn-dependent protease
VHPFAAPGPSRAELRLGALRLRPGFVLLGALVLPTTLPRGPLAMALGALALLVVVVLHELGHALVLRKLLGETPQLTLTWAGSYSHTRRRPTATEARWAAVGGLTVSVLVVALTGLGVHDLDLLRAPPQTVAGTLTRAVFEASAALTVLQLLPIAPLDGSVLVAGLWRDEPRITHGVSAVAAVIVLGLLAWLGQPAGVLIAGYLLLGNVATLRAPVLMPRARSALPPELEAALRAQRAGSAPTPPATTTPSRPRVLVRPAQAIGGPVSAPAKPAAPSALPSMEPGDEAPSPELARTASELLARLTREIVEERQSSRPQPRADEPGSE